MDPKWRVLIVLVATSACSPTDEPALVLEPFSDGSRLQAKTLEAAGARRFLAWRDTERGQDCAFSGFVVPGDVDYCLPLGAIYPSTEYYSNNGCTDALFEGEATSVLVVPPESSCEGEPEVFKVGDRVSAQDAYVLGSDGTCSKAANISVPLWRPGSPIPLDSFARATATVEPTGGRIAALTLVADDGARQVVAGWDLQREEAVTPYRLDGPGGPARWLPVQVAYTGAHGGPSFADADCTRPAATKIAHSAICPITSVIEFEEGETTCGSVPIHVSEARPHDGPTYYEADDQCIESTSQTTELAVEVGDVIPWSEFALVATSSAGEGRLVVRLAGSFDGQGIFPLSAIETFFDTELEVGCGPAIAEDGRLRCMPLEAYSTWYADDACSQPIYVQVEPIDCDAAPPAAVMMGGKGFTVGPALDLSAVYVVGSECEELIREEGSAYHAFAVDELPPEAFVEVNEP